MQGLGFQPLSRKARRFGVLLGLAALLFAQAALAIAACNVDGAPSRGAALAMQADSPCHEAAPASDALCAAHCQASDPTLDKTHAQPAVLPVLMLSSRHVRLSAARSVSPPAQPAPPASPPARILFQTLLI
jgi:hypothetical protein